MVWKSSDSSKMNSETQGPREGLAEGALAKKKWINKNRKLENSLVSD